MNITNLDFSESDPSAVFKMADLVQDYCTQLDNKIILAVSLILLYFLFHNIILPRALQGFKSAVWESGDGGYSWLYTDYIYPGYGYLMSFIETLGLGAAIFMIGFYWFWGWPWYTWAIIIFGGVSCTLIFLAWLVGYVRRWFKS